jgi:hypothetical protein
VSGYRSHVATTVWPIAALFVVELVRSWPGLQGAPAYAVSASAGWLGLAGASLVVVVSLFAYAHGWKRFSSSGGDASHPYRSEGCVRLQRLAGGIAWGFVVAHLVVYWAMAMRAGPVAISRYELFRMFLSRPPVLAFYVIGLTALGLYLGQGIAASFRAWGLGRRPETSRWLEVGCTVASAMMMLMAVNVLGHFATGRAYWSSPSPSTSTAADPDRRDAP